MPAEWRAEQGWKTDFSNFTLHPDSLTITSARDNKAPLDYPKFETIESASRWLEDREPVTVVSINGDVRAYPIQIMYHHDIANDIVAANRSWSRSVPCVGVRSPSTGVWTAAPWSSVTWGRYTTPTC